MYYMLLFSNLQKKKKIYKLKNVCQKKKALKKVSLILGGEW